MKVANLEPFFRYTLSNKAKRDMGWTKLYPNYNQIIRKYRSQWNNTQGIVLIENIDIKDQVYSLPYEMIGGGYIELNFNICKLKQMIQDYLNGEYINHKDYKEVYKLNVTNCSEDFMSLRLDSRFIKMILEEEFIDKEYAMNCIDKEEPIICVDMTGLTVKEPAVHIVDGNHRAYGKLKAGKDTIEGYLVGRNMWIDALMTNKDKMFVKIFSNIMNITNYNCGIETIAELEKKLYDI